MDGYAVRTADVTRIPVRLPSEDIAAGGVVFPAGTQLRTAHIGVLASLGIGAALVRPRPTVAVLSTGSELAGPGNAARW